MKVPRPEPRRNYLLHIEINAFLKNLNSWAAVEMEDSFSF